MELNKVYRHNRLFNLVVIPISLTETEVVCDIGDSKIKHIDKKYFYRDWTIDNNILVNDIKAHSGNYTEIYISYFEQNHEQSEGYIYFDDCSEEEIYRFPLWKFIVLDKLERDKQINPYTIIMPVFKDKKNDIEHDLNLMNEIRLDNEILSYEDFTSFEFGLIKLLEKKYLRHI